jgi:hypothetical protein
MHLFKLFFFQVMQRLIHTLISICCCACLLTACASAERYYVVRDHAPLVSTLGFHITPPPGDDWYEKHQEESLYFLKLSKPTTYSLSTKATELVLDRKFIRQKDFMEYVKGMKELHDGTTQYSNASSTFTWEDSLSPFCVRYQQNYEDRGIKNLSKNDFVQVKKIGLVCMHPESTEVGIDISYLEKFISNTRNLSYQDEGEKFLSSLQFMPKRK